MTTNSLADAVLPLVRTRADLHRWGVANEHGRQMHAAVDILQAAIPTADPSEAHAVTHQALASAITVIARADDSSGIIGDACRRLLDLHPRTAAAARVPVGKLIDWMMTFQFNGEVDFFELDPVAYAPALGNTGVAAYRARLDAVRSGLGPEPPASQPWADLDPHRRWVLEWNDRRLAVLYHDIDAIIRTHAKDQKVAAWLQDTAKAFEEIDEIDLAIDWARQALDIGPWHQSLQAADYWCDLLDQHRPSELIDARLLVFHRWPSSATATGLHNAAGSTWPGYRDEVISTLSANPGDVVLFALLTLKDTPFAWDLAHSLQLSDDRTWTELIDAYEKLDPLAVLPIHARLVESELTDANAQRYRTAARRLAKMRKLAAGSANATEVDHLIADLRRAHHRRPRLQQEFDRAGLP